MVISELALKIGMPKNTKCKNKYSDNEEWINLQDHDVNINFQYGLCPET